MKRGREIPGRGIGCVCQSVLLIWGTNKLVGWLLLGCGIKKACLAVGGGGRKGRGVLLWKTMGDKRRE